MKSLLEGMKLILFEIAKTFEKSSIQETKIIIEVLKN